MLLQKTAKAIRELAPGQRSLSQRERNLLLLADGKTTGELTHLLGQGSSSLIEQLVLGEYLISAQQDDTVTETIRPSKSLASTRMFLFDVCERMFANRHEDIAQAMRQKLREARDKTALRHVCLEILHAVENIAGPKRAAAIAPHLHHLLTDLTLNTSH